ncbi:unnamed protein product [Paramecium octaurelia]|uniref:Transmembrane protein n=1 Tax=Paramecium octaurelia TaxID=43137 RepID=A0A8S1TT98_PAROT|nr:unnamed protein product [Paramecium octaurelia]
MYQKVVNLIQVADMFGADITLNIQNKGKFTSIFGGFMSLMVWFVMLYVFISQGVDLINRVDQQAVTRTINDISPNARVLNISNFMIGIKLDDPLQILLNTTNQTMFSITVYQNNITTFPNKTRTKSVNTSLIIEQCTSQHFQSLDLISDSDQVETFTNYYCLPLNYSFVLEGTYNSQHFQYTQIKVSACKNSTQCFTEDQLNLLSERQTFKLSTLMFTTIINPFSNDAIISQQLFQDFYQQSTKLQEQVSDIFLEPNTLEIDNSVFPFQEDSFFGEFWSFRLGNIRSFINDYAEPTSYFAVNLRISSEYYSSFISFKKFGDFISFIGGTLKMITSVIGIIVIKYNIIGFKLMLANTLYQCKLDDVSKSQKKAELNDIFKFIQKEKEKAEAMLQKFRGSTKKLFQFNKVTGIFKSQRFSQIYKSDADLIKDVQQQTNQKRQIQQNQNQQLMNINQQIILKMLSYKVWLNNCLWLMRKLGQDSILQSIIFPVSGILKDIKGFIQYFKNRQSILIMTWTLFQFCKSSRRQIKQSKFCLMKNSCNFLIIFLSQQSLGMDIKFKIHNIPRIQQLSQIKMLKLFRAYQEVQLDENEKQINSRLVEYLGPVVQKVFQQSHQITENYNKMKQEEQNQIKSTKRPTLNTINLTQNDQTRIYGPNYLLSKSDAIEMEDIAFD